MFSQLKIGYEAAQRAHEELLKRGLTPKEEVPRDEHGQPGTLQHLMDSSESELEDFIRMDKLKTWSRSPPKVEEVQPRT